MSNSELKEALCANSLHKGINYTCAHLLDLNSGDPRVLGVALTVHCTLTTELQATYTHTQTRF